MNPVLRTKQFVNVRDFIRIDHFVFLQSPNFLSTTATQFFVMATNLMRKRCAHEHRDACQRDDVTAIGRNSRAAQTKDDPGGSPHSAVLHGKSTSRSAERNRLKQIQFLFQCSLWNDVPPFDFPKETFQESHESACSKGNRGVGKNQ